MVSEKSRKVAADIKSLRIQGASRIRAAFVRAIADDAKSSKSKNISSFRKEIKSAMLLLVSARCTEPEMRTAARIILHTLNSDFGNVGKLKNAVAKKCNDYEKNMQVKMKKMVRYGAKLVKKDSVIFTHCHSHTVVNAIIAAKPRVKEVIFTETRPLFQGHRTANDLSAAGIKGTMIVDSGAASMLPKAQIFFSGCDALLADGSVVNKIGTKGISELAKLNHVPHYVFGSSHKFDPLTYYGQKEMIEQRNPAEIWNKKLKHIKISNPAFDITPAENVKGIVCEFGVLSPQKFAKLMEKKLRLKSKKAADFDLKKLLK